ncbi:TRAP transporter substrate-binding protein [Sulfurospirillum barnesii]|uniref:TRAP-type mannitol/chloroaromatic compound transport system, periplasmic component n=1 Tax=Sulfurospirillum barnesii (strain ATCC 700032 / DSM 10660 / SES-3) TaxID=760154 RepID=I3XXL2_SULBS|nr:TRAP transporter substrate-binding protein DctP [Sulfurospirillum barnesii]AFL68686.1 TRAP-type mannitol/chloroaromatic compound transport system, periplasmic component [Sulfurospirillum barnesii SES-3]
MRFILCILCLSASVVFAESKIYTLTLASSWGEQIPILGSAPYKVAKLAEEMSQGRLIIKVDLPQKHKAPLGIMDMVKEGLYDIGYTTPVYYKGKDYKLVFFMTVPFGMTTTEQYAWYYYGGGKTLSEKVYAPHGLISYPGGSVGISMGGWFKKEIVSLEDLKGLKIRISGQGGDVMARLGVNALSTSPGELYMAMETGLLDAVEWISPAFDMAMGFHKVAPYYYTGWSKPSGEGQYLVNQKKFHTLPQDLKRILESAIKITARELLDESNDANAKTWAKMQHEYPHIKINHFPKEVMNALKKAAHEVEEEQANKDALYKEILESQRSYIAKIRPWSMMGEVDYLSEIAK